MERVEPRDSVLRALFRGPLLVELLGFKKRLRGGKDAEMSIPVPDFRAGLYYTLSLRVRFVRFNSCEIQVASRSRIVTKPSISFERTAHGLARRQQNSPPTEP